MREGFKVVYFVKLLIVPDDEGSGWIQRPWVLSTTAVEAITVLVYTVLIGNHAAAAAAAHDERTTSARRVTPAPALSIDTACSPANLRVFLELSGGGAVVGRLVLQLFPAIAPLAAENFRCLCTGERDVSGQGRPLCYRGSPFHRVLPGLGLQGGDITHGDGSGGESIYGAPFRSGPGV